MITICRHCGKPFEAQSYKNKLCSEECKRERIKLQKQKQKPNNNKSIVEISKKAKEMGLSYGEYVARGIGND